MEATGWRRGLALADTYEFRFRRRYNLPPTDPRFLAATIEDMTVDYWAHAHLDDPKLREQDMTEDYEGQLAAMEADIASAGAPLAVAEGALAALARFKAEMAGGKPSSPPKAAEPAPVVVEQMVTTGPVPMEDEWEDVHRDRFE